MRPAAVALALLSLSTLRVAGAQEGETRGVDGRIVKPSAETLVPVPGVWVVLHRVGTDEQGPLDSVRTSASGAYRFRYRRAGSEDAVYFVSASYGGLAYFSAPLRDASVSGEDAEIVVYDTTSRPVPIVVRGHHVIVSEPAGGEREIIEVFELSNDTSVTRVSSSSREPVWSTLLPDEAREPALRQGDVSADAVAFEQGRAKVFAPLAPGLRQIAYSYRVPEASLPLAIPVEHHAEMLEVLVEAPNAEVSGARLVRSDPVSLEGRGFSRFLADEVAPGAVVRIDMAESAASRRGLWLRIVAIAVGAAMLLALARIAASSRRGGVRARARRGEDPERLAREIASLDAAHERRGAPSASAEAEYRARREALKARLGDALDRQRQER